MNQRLYRSHDDRVLAGVAGGIAETYGFDPALVRIGWVLLVLFSGGVFLIVYIAMALVVPLSPDDTPAGTWSTEGAAAAMSSEPTAQPPISEREARRRQRMERRQDSGPDAGGALLIGLLLIVVGGFFLAQQYIPNIAWGQLWPVALIVIGSVLLLGAFRRTSR
jgi:phage shock protein C